MHRRGSIKKEECALLVIDMQKYFCDPASDACVPDAGMVLEKVKSLTAAFTRARRPIVFTRHIDDPANRSLMFEWWSENILTGDPRSALSSELDVRDGMVIEKRHYDAFLNTMLEQYLRDRQVTQVVISGVLTNLCCETTARSAFMRGFHVFFLDDATGTYTADMHRATVLNLSYGFATILKSAEVLTAMGESC